MRVIGRGRKRGGVRDEDRRRQPRCPPLWTGQGQPAHQEGRHLMGAITTRDGTEVFYKDWGGGRPVVFSHGWPLTADAWDGQLRLLASTGYRAIAHDRRGGGPSGQPWNGNDLDTYADDLAAPSQKPHPPRAGPACSRAHT